MKMNVPFLDLVTPHVEMEEELIAIVRKALRSAAFIGGPEVEGFEKAFAKFCDAEQCIAVNSGTDALRFALMAAGVKAGDCVLTVPNTFIATTEAISQAGATPEFVDIDEQTYNMDARALRRYCDTACTRDKQTRRPISKRSGKMITAIVPVHLYGQMADMDAIQEVAVDYNLMIIEDACQAHGAEYFSQREGRWMKAGSFGKAAAFSFYPGKNLGACGEAGAVTTNDAQLAAKVRMLRDHGQSEKYYHDVEGYNGRLDAIQCGMLRAKLERLADWNQQRRDHADFYREMLEGVAGLVLPVQPSNVKPVYHLFVVRVQDRQQMQDALKAAGVGTGIHYPIPLHQQKAYQSLGYRKGDFPMTELVAPQILSLPMFPQMTREQQEHVVAEVKMFLKQTAPAEKALAAVAS